MQWASSDLSSRPSRKGPWWPKLTSHQRTIVDAMNCDEEWWFLGLTWWWVGYHLSQSGIWEGLQNVAGIDCAHGVIGAILWVTFDGLLYGYASVGNNVSEGGNGKDVRGRYENVVAREIVLAIAYGTENSYLCKNCIWEALRTIVNARNCNEEWQLLELTWWQVGYHLLESGIWEMWLRLTIHMW